MKDWTDLFQKEDDPGMVRHGRGDASGQVIPGCQRPVPSTPAIHMRLECYRAAAGLGFAAHRLQHSFANGLLNVGMPVASLRKLPGYRWLLANDKHVQTDYLAAFRFPEGRPYARA
ncbi:MAG: hypothetical protein JXA13_17090 [Anaerolineales bacterium]|nr:hypothetical protein [Anaerolineales bacterium]